MNDYIELGPDDVIREGDEYQQVAYNGDNWWLRCVDDALGKPTKMFDRYRFRRPRSVAIRDAALDACREWYYGSAPMKARAMLNLVKTLGVTVEELRKPNEQST